MNFYQLKVSAVNAEKKVFPVDAVIQAGVDGWPSYRCDRLVMRGQAVKVQDNPKPVPVEPEPEIAKKKDKKKWDT